MFYCLDRLLSQYDISPPFLDVGCGVGDISRYVATKGWYGKAIDFSNIAIEKARLNLSTYKYIEVEKKSLFSNSTARGMAQTKQASMARRVIPSLIGQVWAVGFAHCSAGGPKDFCIQIRASAIQELL